MSAENWIRVEEQNDDDRYPSHVLVVDFDPDWQEVSLTNGAGRMQFRITITRDMLPITLTQPSQAHDDERPT